MPTAIQVRRTAITSPELTPPVGPFSQATEAGGFIYFSGQVGQDPTTGKLVAGGIAAETERVFRNLSAVLEAAGRSFDDVVRAGVYLANMNDFVAMNGIFMPMFIQGLQGVNRRLYDGGRTYTYGAAIGPSYSGQWWSAVLLGIAQLFFIVNFFWSIRRGAKASANAASTSSSASSALLFTSRRRSARIAA